MRIRTFIDHAILIAGALFMSLPLFVVLASSTHDGLTLAREGLQIWPGDAGGAVYGRLLSSEAIFAEGVTVPQMIVNSFIVALGFAVLKTITSLLAAYAFVYFRPRFGAFWFGLILASLFFPVETRFLPTFLVTHQLGLLNSYTGVVLPLIATGYGVLLFRQYFRQVPKEMIEAARMDGAGPIRFLIDILIPSSIGMISALFVILFVLGWNQYLWPILVATSDEGIFTLMRGFRRAGNFGPLGMGLAVIAVLPPALLVIVLQRHLFRGLTEATH